MNLEKIRNDIPKAVKQWADQNANAHRNYVSILSYRYGEIVERTFAVRFLKSGLKITEVRRRATGEHETIVKNMYYTRMGGYTPVFEARNCGYNFYKDEFNKWFEVYPQYFQFDSICLNADILTNIDEFKYCGYQNGNIITYLNEYRKNPLVEYIGKLDLPLSPMLIKKLGSDKQFKTFVFKNLDEVRKFGSSATTYAYNHKLTIAEADRTLFHKRQAVQYIPNLKGQKKLDYERVLDYCNKNKIGYHLYNDYLKAIIELKLDLEDTKNIYPKDFERMHDLRTMEYDSLLDKQDREKRKELYSDFAKAGKKAIAYQFTANGLSIVAPQDISELVAEGKALSHCVGKMGYDKKMANNEIVIMFVRHTENINDPFVTIEFDLKQKKLRQAYAEHNSQPPTEVITFLNEWVVLMQKLLKKESVNNGKERLLAS